MRPSGHGRLPGRLHWAFDIGIDKLNNYKDTNIHDGGDTGYITKSGSTSILPVLYQNDYRKDRTITRGTQGPDNHTEGLILNPGGLHLLTSLILNPEGLLLLTSSLAVGHRSANQAANLPLFLYNHLFLI